MNANIKDGILHNGNPDINASAKPLFSLGDVSVGDVIYSSARQYRVLATGIRVIGEYRVYEHGIKVETIDGEFETVFTNEKEDSDFSGIWE